MADFVLTIRDMVRQIQVNLIKKIHLFTSKLYNYERYS
jgi:hypothetical protein